MTFGQTTPPHPMYKHSRCLSQARRCAHSCALQTCLCMLSSHSNAGVSTDRPLQRCALALCTSKYEL